MGEQWKQCQTLFSGAPKSLQMVTAAMKLKDAYSLEGKLWPTYIAYSKAEILKYTWNYMIIPWPVKANNKREIQVTKETCLKRLEENTEFQNVINLMME